MTYISSGLVCEPTFCITTAMWLLVGRALLLCHTMSSILWTSGTRRFGRLLLATGGGWEDEPQV